VSHILGYARVSTDDQDLASQRTRLESAGAFRVFADVISGKTFDRPRIALLSLEEKIDTSSAAGELVFHVFGAIAQFERRLIAERTRDGMNAARAKGSKPGRPVLNQEKLSAALMLVKGGMSPTQAARRTGLGRSTVYREIQSRPNA
jgi:DNA invertase Pin-like site-specific DNA recombinase